LQTAETVAQKPVQKSWKRASGVVILGAIVLAIFAYLALIVLGRIPSDHRLGLPEIGLAIVASAFIALFTYPEGLSRLSLLKLPGGIELTLAHIQQQQAEQQEELNAFFAILTNLLSTPEKYHLRALARGGEKYTGCASMREELFRLMRYGLAEEIEGQNVGDIHDGREVDLAAFLRLTQTGHKFVRALPGIEAH
jgi:hypothetical protein